MDFSNLKTWNIKKLEKNKYEVKNMRGERKYIGGLKNKKPNGFGEYFSSINHYKGTWKNGKRHGKGICKYSNGNVYYDGSWKNDFQNGMGILFFKNKTKLYEGFLKKSLFHKKGSLYYKNGKLKYKGNFLDSKYNGFGILYNQIGYKQFEGSWKDGKKNGLCKEYNSEGNIIFEGEYKEDKKDGYGYIYEDNFPDKYTFWKNGKMLKTQYKPFPKKFIFVKKLGGGGFGNIDLYKDKTNGKLYAVKKLVERYKKEDHHLIIQYRNLSFLKEKKICEPYFLCPYGIFKDKSGVKIVFNFLEGYETFDEFRKKNISIHKKKNICRQMMKQLNILHRIGMIHSDIKSENIMVNPKTLQTRIIDFGCAIIIDKENKSKKYHIHGFTERYFQLSARRKHKFGELKKNDVNALTKLIYFYLSGTKKNITFTKRLEYIRDNLY